MECCHCPICGREYELNPKVCTCGFDGLEYQRDWLCRDLTRDEYYHMYKYTKRVFYGEIPYEKSPLDVLEYDDVRIVSYAMEKRGLAVVTCYSAPGEKKTVAEEGLLAMKGNVKALILDVDEAESYFLDESSLRILFFGEHFRSFQNGYFAQLPPIRYLYVHPKNPYFKSENNVMFSKDGTRLIAYPRCRPEEEYTVPSTVKELANGSIFCATALKVLRLPKKIRIAPKALERYMNGGPEIVYY